MKKKDKPALPDNKVQEPDLSYPKSDNNPAILSGKYSVEQLREDVKRQT